MAKIHRALWLRFLLLTLLSSMASAQLPITDDSYISSGSSTLQGTNPSLAVQGPTASILIRPDISQLNLAGVSAGQVTKGYLKLYRTAVAVGGNIDVCEVSSTWAEKTIVYGSKPNLGTSLATNVVIATNTAGQYLTLDITQAVKDWLSGATNNGIAIIPANSCAWGSSSSTISMTFDSKESTTSSHAPEIDVVLNNNLTQLPGQIGPSQVAAGNYAINISGTAATATQFDHNPAQCGANLFATGITTGGNANCATPAFSQLSGQITNAQLQNNSITINTTTPGLFGGGIVPLGGSITLSNTGVLSFNGRAGLVSPMVGDYSFSQLSGTAAKNQLPGTAVFNDQSNTFAVGFKQVFQSNGTAGLNIAAAVGNANPTSPAVGDLWFRLDLKHLHFNDGTTTHQLMYSDDTILGSQVTGNISGLQVTGNISGNAANVTGIVATGNGGTGANTAATALTNLGAASATNLSNEITRATGAETTLQTNINNEVTARAAADTTLQTNINTEAATRATADVSLANSISFETTRATGAEGTLQTNINTLSAASAQLNGGNLFTGGKQTMAAAAATFASLNIPSSGSPPSMPAPGDVWLANGNPHLQFKTMSGLESLAFYSDITTATIAQTTALNNEIARATGAESALTTSLAGEVTRATGVEMSLSSSLTSEVTRATGAEAALNLSKANLAGGNLFTGGSQVLAGSATGYPSLNIPNGSAAPNSAVTGDLWLLSGNSHLQFQSMSGLESLAFYSDITTATNAQTTALNNEIARATGAENTLTLSLAGEVTRATGAEMSLSNSLTSEVTRATGAEAALNTSKANLAGGNLFTGGSQTLAQSATSYPSLNIPVGGAAPSTLQKGDIWTLSTDPHLHFQDMTNATQMLAFTSDVTAANSSTLSSANSYTDTKVATEASARSAADASEALARASGDATTLASANTYTGSAVSAEAVLRAAGDAAAVSSANAYTDGQVATINTSLAGKANLSGGNNFAGNQSITGNASITGNETLNGTLSLPAVSTISGTPASSHLLNLQGWDGTDATVFQWFVNNGGFLDLFTGTGGNSPTASGLKIGPDGKITFATGQTFPGTQSALTAGTGIGITGNTISNTGVTGLAGTLNQVNVSAGTGAVTLSLPSSVSIGGTMSAASFSGNGSALTNLNASNLSSGTVPSGALAGSYGISITGSASTITGSIGGGQVNGNIAGNAANVTGTVAVANGGTGLTSGTSGGVLGFTAPGTLASSGALASGGVVLGGGAGATPSTSADFTTTSATNSAALKVGKSGTGTPNTGDLGALFLAGSTNGGPTLASQATGGSLTLQLPNTAPTANQVLTATAVNTNTVTLGFSTPSAGTVTTTGTPASGNLTKFSGTASVTNGDLSGDCTTTGTLSVTCTKTNGTAFAASATSDTTNAINITGGTVSTARGGTGVSGAAVFPTSGTVATTTTPVGGDLSGTISSATVTKINGSLLGTTTGAANGQVLAWNGASWVPQTVTAISAFPIPTDNTQPASQTTTSTAYTDLATVGPTLTVLVSATGKAQVTITSTMSNSNNNNGCLESFSVDGGAVTDATSIQMNGVQAGGAFRMSGTYLVSGLSAGSHLFTAKYRASATTCTYSNRNMIVTAY